MSIPPRAYNNFVFNPKDFIGPIGPAGPAGSLNSAYPSVVVTTSTYNVTKDDYLILVENPGPTVCDIILPKISTEGKFSLMIIDAAGNSATHNIDILPHAGDTINGFASAGIYSDNGKLQMINDGVSRWWTF